MWHISGVYNKSFLWFELEKVLHEFIRDLPELQKLEITFSRGYLTGSEAIHEAARIITEEMENRRHDG